MQLFPTLSAFSLNQLNNRSSQPMPVQPRPLVYDVKPQTLTADTFEPTSATAKTRSGIIEIGTLRGVKLERLLNKTSGTTKIIAEEFFEAFEKAELTGAAGYINDNGLVLARNLISNKQYAYIHAPKIEEIIGNNSIEAPQTNERIRKAIKTWGEIVGLNEQCSYSLDEMFYMLFAGDGVRNATTDGGLLIEEKIPIFRWLEEDTWIDVEPPDYENYQYAEPRQIIDPRYVEAIPQIIAEGERILRENNLVLKSEPYKKFTQIIQVGLFEGDKLFSSLPPEKFKEFTGLDRAVHLPDPNQYALKISCLDFRNRTGNFDFVPLTDRVRKNRKNIN